MAKATTLPVFCVIDTPGDPLAFGTFIQSSCPSRFAWLARVRVDEDEHPKGPWDLLIWDAPRRGNTTSTSLGTRDLGLSKNALFTVTPYAFAQLRPVALSFLRKTNSSGLSEDGNVFFFASARMAALLKPILGDDPSPFFGGGPVPEFHVVEDPGGTPFEPHSLPASSSSLLPVAGRQRPAVPALPPPDRKGKGALERRWTLPESPGAEPAIHKKKPWRRGRRPFHPLLTDLS